VYVPQVQRAWHLWEQLQHDSGRALLQRTGGLMLGPAHGELVAGARASAERHGLPHEMLTGAEIRRRFPPFAADQTTVGLWEQQAGVLDPEACVDAALDRAARQGAVIRTGTRVDDWNSSAEGVTLSTSGGTIACDHLILAAGAWMPSLLHASLPLTIERQVMWWFEPNAAPALFAAEHCPVFIWEWEPSRFFYGIPDQGAGFKVARHHEGDTVDPETVDRAASLVELATMRRLLERHIPLANGALRESAVCLYTNTPDHHFILGPHPADSRVTLASPCSGHGFKFASAIGEVLADLATTGRSSFDLSPFAPTRF
jgi:sarcosine oxidase